ncbi:PREDICTED: CCR4-NOT transcription complex subunit 10 isoform X2 [Camelina sativa]|uniref:CCR4-NOT transcription complex subunit 10 isoform X1 n=1 Tax=Camelina sativa TaxID=90675 RepID=A0ABM1QPS7_CAMSA|nr:PREDICTED: CCR4-NOT transcription complex subunit 10 isoform X1 [Camelina sativa]XP_019088765.1 PREDICTED: CCR4-NOT transcription complex subunit 10 isoform X2 [Camelina sativa]
MDSRDSSSAVASDAARDASLLSEDAAVLSVTSTLAKSALSCFQSGKFEDCIDILIQLDQKQHNDPKVLHNMAIAEYFKGGCSKSKKLLEELNCVKKQSEELASAAREQVEAVNPGTNVSVSKDQFDSTVTTLNIAVTWFHMHQYTKSSSILEPLFQNIGRLDETIALQICFLLLDIALASHDAVKFLAVFDYMDKAFGVGFGSHEENGSTMQLSSNQGSKTSSLLSSSVVADTVAESSLCEETLDYDNVLAAEFEAEKRMKSVGHIPANNLLKTLSERSFSTADLKLELQLYKVRFLLLTRNLKLAKREVKHAMNIAQKRDSSMALLLKSQLEYAHGNHQKAMKLLVVSGIHKESGTSGIFNNNLGCIYYQLGKYEASSQLFSKALRSCSSLRNEKPVKTFSLSQNKSLLITYNMGLLYLARGEPLLAAQCFQKASVVFCRQPLIWLRLAECCMMALQSGLLDRSEIRVNVVGKGKYRKLMIEENEHVELDGSAQCGKLSLPLARACLSNGIYLLNESLLNESKSDRESTLSVGMNETKEASSADHGEANTNSDLKEAKGGLNQDIIQSSLSAFKNIQSREKLLIKQALLANMAYVELELENPIKALAAANSLLQVPDCSKIYVFLGHLYAAEALCLLNRPVEAGAHLSAYLVGQDDFKLPYEQEDFDQWRMHTSSDCEETLDSSTGNARDSVFLKPEEARGALFADLAALLATQGHHDQAKAMITHALTLIPNNVQATVTAVYIDMMLGRSQDALTRLKQCTRVSFVPGRLEVRAS